MTQRELEALVRGMTPVLKELITRTVAAHAAPQAERLAAASMALGAQRELTELRVQVKALIDLRDEATLQVTSLGDRVLDLEASLAAATVPPPPYDHHHRW